jgi:hypothetical protein
MLSDESAAQMLNEVGELQKAVDEGNLGPREAIDPLISRMEMLTANYEGSTVYAAFVEPCTQWGIYWAPRWITPGAPNAEAWKELTDAISQYHDRWSYLKP